MTVFLSKKNKKSKYYYYCYIILKNEHALINHEFAENIINIIMLLCTSISTNVYWKYNAITPVYESLKCRHRNEHFNKSINKTACTQFEPTTRPNLLYVL